jgi:hypothetical protein
VCWCSRGCKGALLAGYCNCCGSTPSQGVEVSRPPATAPSPVFHMQQAAITPLPAVGEIYKGDMTAPGACNRGDW